MERKYFFKIIIGLSVALAAMAGIIVFIDPFYHYHKPLKKFLMSAELMYMSMMEN